MINSLEIRADIQGKRLSIQVVPGEHEEEEETAPKKQETNNLNVVNAGANSVSVVVIHD